MRCAYCGSNEHEIKFCPKTWNGQGNLNSRKCAYCGSREHFVDECPKTWDGQIRLREKHDG
jgi:hypothetical protein